MGHDFPAGRVRLARRIAIAADVAQVLALPLLVAPPVAEGVNIVIDVAVGVALCVILRPHWAFAPTFLAELIPVAGAIPFWWASVRFVTRGDGPDPPDPLPAPLPPPPPATPDRAP